MKKRVIKYIRNILISAAVLLVLIVGAGVAYIWYMGQDVKPSTTAQAALVDNTAPDLKHVVQSENNRQGVAIQSLTSPLKPGSSASITIRTNTNSSCKISVKYNEVASKDPGLITKATDEFGMVTWFWTIEPSVPVGKWPVTATCSRGDKTAVVVGDLVISNTIKQ